MKLNDCPYMDRPHEKLLNYGAGALTDSELLSIILKTGIKNKSALDLSKEIMSKDKESIGFYFLNQYSIEELTKIKGVGLARAIQIKALLELCNRNKTRVPIPGERITTPDQLSMIFMNDLQYKKQEILKTAMFDTKNRVKAVITNSIGTINCNSIDIREILTEPVKRGAAKIALAHNHPSGDVTPSTQDIEFTSNLLKACKIFGIELLDHIIIGNGEYSSFRKLCIF